MSKRKAYEIFLSAEDRIDVDLEFNKAAGAPPQLVRFAITYSARTRGRWREVIRYDNFHGTVHRQRFWRAGEPERMRAWNDFRSMRSWMSSVAICARTGGGTGR